MRRVGRELTEPRLSVLPPQQKMLDGWVDLDKIPNPGFNADGTKKAP